MNVFLLDEIIKGLRYHIDPLYFRKKISTALEKAKMRSKTANSNYITVGERFLTALTIAEEHAKTLKSSQLSEEEVWNLSFQKAQEMSDAGYFDIDDIIDLDKLAQINTESTFFLRTYPKIWFAFFIASFSPIKRNTDFGVTDTDNTI